MLAERRRIAFSDVSFRTPIVVPSFSSKGFPDVAKMIDVCSEYISSPILVSAYDIQYHKVRLNKLVFSDFVIVDSGGYELSTGLDLSEYGKEVATKPKTWRQSDYLKVAKSLPFDRPTILVSYDNPRRAQSLEAQIERASNLFGKLPKAKAELLLKSDPPARAGGSGYIDIEHVLALTNEVGKFEIVGFTEKELGASIFERMINIARVRHALQQLGNNAAIHVFGSLDPISTPLYFLSGADVFDGLTWLRYGYINGCAIYSQNYGAMHLPIDTKFPSMNAHLHSRNYTYLQELQSQMRQFLGERKFDVFNEHAGLMRSASEKLAEHMGAR